MFRISLCGKQVRFVNDISKVDAEKKVHIIQAGPGENFLRLIGFLENHPGREEDIFYLLTEDIAEMRQLFFSHFLLIDAAGGLVKNAEGKTLMIFRKGKWDLPKGKMEEGETPPEAALREVSEECGIAPLKITGEIGPTYHSYFLGGERVMKKTYWFEMIYEGNDNLKPQTAEGITEARWMEKEEIKKCLENSFPTIGYVFG